MPPPPTHATLITAYRHLHRSLLHAVRFAKPARYIIRARLSHVFRTSPASDFDAARVARTLEFLQGAATVRGIEHRILRNLVHVRWGMEYASGKARSKRDVEGLKRHAYRQYEETLRRLNDSLGLCLK